MSLNPANIKNKTTLLIGLISISLVVGCGGDSEPEVNCNIMSVELQITESSNSACGSSDGSITVQGFGGDGQFGYKLNGGAFGASNVFEELSPGSYEITVEDGNGCSATESVELSSGVSYTNSIKSIIETDCAISGCHVSGTSRVDLTIFNNIAGNAAGIKSRTGSGDMPRGGRTLTQTQKDLIACWVNDGAQNN
ncbi:MAG: hypothetical protein JXQ96_22200 [Cyclobacteriaceae bacterium]